MLAKVLTSAVVGLDGALVEVEVDMAPGLPGFTIVGLADTAIQEAPKGFASPSATPAARSRTGDVAAVADSRTLAEAALLFDIER